MGSEPRKVTHGGAYSVFFQCTGCQKSTFQAWFEVHLKPAMEVRKLGQSPPWDIEIPKELERSLGADALFYKRAKICISQGYGLAACAYMRRVLEGQITPILKLILKEGEARGARETDLEKIREVVAGKAFDKKMELAYKDAPETLVVKGVNPLKLIHDVLSQGVHALREDECTQKASQLAAALEFVLSELSRSDATRERFASQMKNLSGK